MRFLLSAAVVGLAALAGAPTAWCSELKVCYPSCTTYTGDFSGNAIDEKTPWSGQIGLNRFNDHGGKRNLTSVTIKTLLYFNSTVWFTRSSAGDGAAKAGVMLHMDIAGANATVLGQYWGRFGNYLELGTTPQLYLDQGQNGQDVSGLDDPADYISAPTLFIPYTYPLFDIVGAPLPAINDVTGGGAAWAYYSPSTDSGTYGWPQFWYGKVGDGIYVDRVINDDQKSLPGVGPISQYFTQRPGDEFTDEQKFQIPNDDTEFPFGEEKLLGTSEFNRFDRNNDTLAFSKTISATDLPGGSGRNILATDMLALFKGTGQIMFNAAATGQVTSDFSGGNAALRQTTYAKVAMRVEYTYTLCSACQDPQFGGFQGQTYQVHGFPGSYFHLFSAPKFQMNGRFTYLANGHCKYSHTPCWTHPGTYVDDITFVVDELLVRITAGAVGAGYSVLVNEEPFKPLSSNSSDFVATKFYDRNTGLTVHLVSPLRVHVKTELVSFTIHNADHFFNIDSQLLARAVLVAGRKPSPEYPHPETGAPWFPEYPIHGFIGQSWANKQYPHNMLYAGQVDDYVEARPYGTDSLFSQYAKQQDKPWE